MKRKIFDLLVLLFLMALGWTFASLTKELAIGKATITGAVIAIPSVIYLGLRKKKNWKKIFVSMLIFGAMFGFILDFIAEYTKAYSVVSLIFPFKIFGVLPLDNLIGHMLMIMIIVTFYEHFIDREKNHHISKNLKYAILPALLVMFLIVISYIFNPNFIEMKYPYFYMGIAAIMPPLFLSFKNPKLIKNMTETGAFFFIFFFIAEFFAVRLGYWTYSGNNYIGWVKILDVTFPFEELFFWIIFYAASIVSYYEIFIDDET